MIHLTVNVENTAELLATQAYGAGALLRWESAAAQTGPFSEGGTVALVSGTSTYDVWDAAGGTGTWYRTRISNAAGTTFSAYSTPFQTAPSGPDLTIAQCRAFPGVPSVDVLPDDSLQLLLNAAIAAINEVAGATGEVTEHIRGHGLARIVTARQIGTVTSITEDDVALAVDDYRASGYVVQRTGHGTNPSWRWGSYVTVVYAPADDTAERQRVQLELVKLDLARNPGLTGQTIGTWAESYGTGTYAAERADILATLGGSGGGMRVID